jgi:hypothetical protein
MPDVGSSPLARIRLAKKVADVLSNLRSGITVETVSTGEMLNGAHEDAMFRGDLSATTLDLKVRFLLLVGETAESLQQEGSLLRAKDLLLTNADTYACVLIADDDLLSCRLIDAYHIVTPSGYRSSVQRKRNDTGPLRIVIDNYFQSISQAWTDPPRMVSIGDFDYESTSLIAAATSLAAKRRERFLVPEKLNAQLSLSDQDALFVGKLVSTMASGEHVDVVQEIQKRSQA